MLRMSTMLAWVVWVAAVPVLAGQPRFELDVRQDRFFGSTPGTLVMAEDGVEFRTSKPQDSRRWDYPAIKQVRVLSPTRITLDTYEDQGRLHLGADRSYTFTVTGAISQDLVAFLLGRIERPMVTAVMPPLPAAALFRVPVKHARSGRGSEGMLTLYETGVAYVTDREGQARFWRFRDIYGLLRLDRYRLQVLAYEGGSGETRAFTFELKTELPPGMYEALWQRINAPARGELP